MRSIVLKSFISSFGALYEYHPEANEFHFERGEGLQVGEVTFPIAYPQKVVMINGTHPELFSANGSHGTWASPGEILQTFLL